MIMKKLTVDLKDFTINGKPANEVSSINEYRESRENKTRIDKYFLDNDFHVWHNELKKYDNVEWIGKESLFIYGNTGTQKTGQVTAICKLAIDRNKSVRYYRATEIVYQKDLDYVRDIDLVVIDNVGYSGKFEESRGALFDFIDYRMHNYKSTILISNENLSEKFNKAFVDRLNMFVKIKIDGKSKRKLINNLKVKKI